MLQGDTAFGQRGFPLCEFLARNLQFAVLSKAHQVRELKNPCQDPTVRELLSRTRKAYAKRGTLPQKKKEALTNASPAGHLGHLR
jgi:hypothetical protein